MMQYYIYDLYNTHIYIYNTNNIIYNMYVCIYVLYFEVTVERRQLGAKAGDSAGIDLLRPSPWRPTSHPLVSEAFSPVLGGTVG